MFSLKEELNNFGLTFNDSNEESIEFFKNMGDLNRQEYNAKIKRILVELDDKTLLGTYVNGEYIDLYYLLKKTVGK